MRHITSCCDCKNHEKTSTVCAHSIYNKLYDKRNTTNGYEDLITAIMTNIYGNHNDLFYNNCTRSAKPKMPKIIVLTDNETEQLIFLLKNRIHNQILPSNRTDEIILKKLEE